MGFRVYMGASQTKAYTLNHVGGQRIPGTLKNPGICRAMGQSRGPAPILWALMRMPVSHPVPLSMQATKPAEFSVLRGGALNTLVTLHDHYYCSSYHYYCCYHCYYYCYYYYHYYYYYPTDSPQKYPAMCTFSTFKPLKNYVSSCCHALSGKMNSALRLLLQQEHCTMSC